MGVADVDLTSAGGSQNLTGFNEVLKEFYLGPVREQLNSDTILMQRLQRDTESVSGRQIRIPVHVARNEGIGAVAEGGLLPDPGAQAYKELTFKVKYHYGRILLTGPVIFASADDKGSFIRALDSEVKGLVDDLKHDVNRQMFSDGSGIIATVDGGSSGSAATTEIFHNYGDFHGEGENLKHIRPGQLYASIDVSSGELDDHDLEVSSVDVASKVVTFTNTISGAGLDDGCNAIVRRTTGTGIAAAAWSATNGAPHTSYVKELMGLLGICHGSPVYSAGSAYAKTDFIPSTAWTVLDPDTPGTLATYAGLQNLTHDLWEPQSVTAETGTSTKVAGLPDLTEMQTLLDLMMEFGQSKPSLILTTYKQRQNYFDQLKTNKRYVNTLELDGGWTALEFNGIPLVADKDCIPGTMFMLDEDQLALFQENDLSWMDRDGNMFHRLQDKDAFQATMFKYYEMGCYRRNGQGFYYGLAE